jgi:tricorn protease-like protein
MWDLTRLHDIMKILLTAMYAVMATVLILSSVALSQPVYGPRGIAIDGVAIAASGDNVYLTWPSNKTGNWEVLFRASNDSGNTFADKINLSNTTDSDSTFKNGIVASAENTVHVSWNDNTTGSVETYVRTSNDGGNTFGNAVLINGTGTAPQKLGQEINSLSPELAILQDTLEATEMAASDNNIYVLSWDNKTGNWEVFLGKSRDGGQTFETINLSNSSNSRSDDAHIVAEEDNVYVTWWETAMNGTRTPLFISSNDNGETFGPVLDVSANGTIGGNGR